MRPGARRAAEHAGTSRVLRHRLLNLHSASAAGSDLGGRGSRRSDQEEEDDYDEDEEDLMDEEDEEDRVPYGSRRGAQRSRHQVAVQTSVQNRESQRVSMSEGERERERERTGERARKMRGRERAGAGSPYVSLPIFLDLPLLAWPHPPIAGPSSTFKEADATPPPPPQSENTPSCLHRPANQTRPFQLLKDYLVALCAWRVYVV